MDDRWRSESDRRTFLRSGLTGLCACGCGGGLLASVPGNAAAMVPEAAVGTPGGAKGVGARDAATGSLPSSPQDADPMPRRWIALLAASLAHRDPDDARGVLKACSASHWEHLGMDTRVGPFRGNLPGFLDFLRSEWGWIIDYDPGAGLIQVNENKSDCVCPLVGKERTPELGTLCYCSEGFAERLFGAVSGRPVRAEVTESILRGGERCRYRIQMEA